ncbi:MAG: allantoinase AllB [Acidobacteria bacterium]|nr:MAG: allantoinase AllB [Acidobacteriota bacterium]
MRTLLHNLVISGKGNERRQAQLLVEGKQIGAVLAPDEVVSADLRIDLGGALALPGAIDGHVHFDDPGFTQREDFATGTRAAAAGGVTMVVDMPCTSLPPVTSAAYLDNKLGIIEGKANVDFMLWGGVSSNVLENPDWRGQLEELINSGVGAIKVYLLSGMETFKGLGKEQVFEVLEITGRHGIPVGVHAEDRHVVDAAKSAVLARGGESPLDYAASRPAEGEITAAKTLRNLCRQTGARIHIVHIASREALDIVTAARSEGLPLSAETCPHYLLFTDHDLDRLGALLKTAPVVKSRRDREGLWRGLESGELLFVASDHAAGVWPEEKHTGSIWTDYGGVPGVELLLPALYSEGVAKGRITLERLVEITSRAPAEFFGVGGRKGRIEKGYDADFSVIDEDSTWTVRASELHNKNRYTPLEGMTLQGRIQETWVRGRRVFFRDQHGREAFSEQPSGRFIKRGGAS